jgi:hypothetical protein
LEAVRSPNPNPSVARAHPQHSFESLKILSFSLWPGMKSYTAPVPVSSGFVLFFGAQPVLCSRTSSSFKLFDRPKFMHSNTCVKAVEHADRTVSEKDEVQELPVSEAPCSQNYTMGPSRGCVPLPCSLPTNTVQGHRSCMHRKITYRISIAAPCHLLAPSSTTSRSEKEEKTVHANTCHCSPPALPPSLSCPSSNKEGAEASSVTPAQSVSKNILLPAAELTSTSALPFRPATTAKNFSGSVVVSERTVRPNVVWLRLNEEAREEAECERM